MAKRKPADIAEELDMATTSPIDREEAPKISDVAEELDAAGYTPPDAVDKPTKIASLDTQKDVAEFVKDMGIFLGQGVLHGSGEELLAAGKTKSFFSGPEYERERDILKKQLEEKREKYPYVGALAEATGATAATMATPFAKAYPVAAELLSSVLQGAGEANTLEDVPREAAKSAAISSGMMAGGKLLKEAVFDDPTKIMTRSIGVRSKDVKGNPNANVIKSVKRLEDAGFFKQGEVGISPGKFKFERSAKNLMGLFKPQTLDSLLERAEKNISVLKSRNENLLKGKKIPSIELQRSLMRGVEEFTYDPLGVDVEARYNLAKEIQDVFLKDLKDKTGWKMGQPIPALDVEQAKRALDNYLGDPAFEKKATDLGINAESMMKFRTKLDDLLDLQKVGGDEYRKNNDLMHDLINVRDIIRSKEARDYLDTGSGQIDLRSIPTKMLEAISPTWADIGRADISKMSETPMGKFVGQTLRQLPVQKFTQTVGNMPEGGMPQEENLVMEAPQKRGYDFSGAKPAFRTPQGFSEPDQIMTKDLPRNSEDWVKNKEFVLQKLAASQVTPELIDAAFEAMNRRHGDLKSIIGRIALERPEIFIPSKYNMVDGVILDPNERAKAADDMSKRDDVGSIQKAKIIRELNKTGKWVGE